MFYLYLDENGDLGFDFINKKPSKFFTVSILFVKGDENIKKIRNAVKRTLRKKLNPKNKRKRIVQELKGASTTFQVKEYFFRQTQGIDFFVYSITLNKKRVYESLVKDKSRIYNWVARLLLEKIDFSRATNRICLILDKSKNKFEISEFNSYIERELEAKIDPKIPLEIKHLDSVEEKCLQAIDVFGWGIFRKYEKRDEEWFNLFKAKIRFNELYLPQNKKERAS